MNIVSLMYEIKLDPNVALKLFKQPVILKILKDPIGQPHK